MASLFSKFCFVYMNYFNIANYIDGSEFLDLTLEELKSMCPLGIAKKIHRFMTHRSPNADPQSQVCCYLAYTQCYLKSFLV